MSRGTACLVAVFALAACGLARADHQRVELWPSALVDEQCRARWPGNRQLAARIAACAVFTVERGRVACTMVLPVDYDQHLWRDEYRTCHGWFSFY